MSINKYRGASRSLRMRTSGSLAREYFNLDRRRSSRSSFLRKSILSPLISLTEYDKERSTEGPIHKEQIQEQNVVS